MHTLSINKKQVAHAIGALMLRWARRRRSEPRSS